MSLLIKIQPKNHISFRLLTEVLWKCGWFRNYTHNKPEKKLMNLYSNLNSQETDFWKFKTSSTSNCSHMSLFAISIWEFVPDPL